MYLLFFSALLLVSVALQFLLSLETSSPKLKLRNDLPLTVDTIYLLSLECFLLESFCQFYWKIQLLGLHSLRHYLCWLSAFRFFFFPSRNFRKTPPERGTYVIVCKVLYSAFKKCQCGCKYSSNCLDRAKADNDPNQVEDIKSALNVLTIFVTLPFFLGNILPDIVDLGFSSCRCLLYFLCSKWLKI